MPAPLPVLLLTRPEPESRTFAESLSADLRNRLRCVISPLFKIAATQETPDLARYEAVVFSSAQAVRMLSMPVPAGLAAYCVGDVTAAAARNAGFTAFSAGRDADALVQMVIDRDPAGAVLHVHGAHSRGDVASRLAQAGLTADEAVVYDQVACDFTPEAKAALDGPAPVLAPVFSPRTGALFAAGYRGQAPLYLAAMSEAVLQEMSALPAKEAQVARAPTARAMAQAVETLATRARLLEGDGGRL